MITDFPLIVVSGTTVPMAPQKEHFGGTRNLIGVWGKEAGRLSHRLEARVSGDHRQRGLALWADANLDGAVLLHVRGWTIGTGHEVFVADSTAAVPRSAARQLAASIMSCHCETGGFLGLTRPPKLWMRADWCKNTAAARSVIRIGDLRGVMKEVEHGT